MTVPVMAGFELGSLKLGLECDKLPHVDIINDKLPLTLAWHTPQETQQGSWLGYC